LSLVFKIETAMAFNGNIAWIVKAAHRAKRVMLIDRGLSVFRQIHAPFTHEIEM
jgi:hypothetical protein